MKAIEVTKDRQITVVEAPVPVLERGEALIKVLCAPVNPADRMQISGTYIVNKSPPFRPGLVAVGKVVEVQRGGLVGALLNGKTVVFAPGPDLDGTYAEFARAPVGLCVPLPAGLKPEQGVNLLANAMTCVALVERAKELGSGAMILTGAAGELGAMINAMAERQGIKVINVVRGAVQVAALRDRDIEIVVDSADTSFAEKLRETAEQHPARLAVDAVAGGTFNTLMDALQDGGTILSIGRLSGERLSFDGMTYLVGKHLNVEGFDVGHWISEKSFLGALNAANRAAKVLRSGHATQVKHRVGFEDLVADFNALGDAQSGGKTLLFPSVS